VRWLSHTLIAWAVSAPFGASPAVLLGATAPDWLEFFLPVRHRETTHTIIFWGLPAAIILLLLFLFSKLLGGPLWHLLWWFVGGTIHWVCDAFTPSGVLLTPWARERVILLSGRIRTGEAAEYVLALGLLLFSLVFFGWSKMWYGKKRFSCFLIRSQWCEAGQEKARVGGEEIPLASPAEIRRHRFEW